MARGNRLWQDSLAHIKFFDGDQNECEKWYAWAKQKLGFMLHSTPGATTQVFTPADGVAIKIDTRPNRIYIKTGVSVYMESGFLSLRNIGFTVPDGYRPATIEFNTFVSLSAQLNASKGRTVSDGDISWAVGCKGAETNEIYYDSGISQYSFTSDTAEFCSTAIVDKKRTQLWCPASMFTGKLRLMVQAIYGSRRNDYRGPTSGLAQPYLEIDSGVRDTEGDPIYVKLDTGRYTSGLYKDPNGGYWLIEIGANIKYRRMKAKIRQNQLEKAGVDVGDADTAEAFMLSTLVPEATSTVMQLSPLQTDETPLFYGWKFNKDGDKASIVVFRTNDSIPCFTGAGVPTTAKGFSSRLYTIAISFDEDAGVPKVLSVSQSTSGAHIPYIQNKIFYPVWAIQAMQCLKAATPDAQPDRFANLKTPAYCYYDRDDELKIFTISNSRPVLTAGYTEYGDPARTDFWVPGMLNADAVGYENTWVRKDYAAGTTTPKNGVEDTDGVLALEAGFSTFGSSSYVSKWYEAAAPNTTSFTIVGLEMKYPQFYGYDAVDYENPTYYSSNTLAPQKGYISAIIVPFYDAESVVVCDQVTTQNSGQTYFVGVMGNNDVIYNKVYSYSVTYIGANPVYTRGAFLRDEYITHDMGADSTSGTFTTFSPSTPGQYAAIDRVVPDDEFSVKKIQRCRLFGSSLPNGNKLVLDELTTTPASLTKLDPIFNVSFSSPIIEIPMTVKAGYNSGSFWSVISTAVGADEWPPGTYIAPVGWA
jgi:hypothetical protein